MVQRLRDEAEVEAGYGVDGIAGGRNCLAPASDGTVTVLAGSPLHEAWMAIQSKPFDLYREPLTRLRVRRCLLPCFRRLCMQEHQEDSRLSSCC